MSTTKTKPQLSFEKAQLDPPSAPRGGLLSRRLLNATSSGQILALLSAVTFSLWSGGAATFAQGELCPASAVMCTVSMGIKSCSAMFNYYPVTGLMSNHVGTGTGLQCSVSLMGYGGNSWFAKRPTTAPATWACSWTGMYPAAPGTALDTFFCRIDASDGLPVELRSFAIEESVAQEGSDRGSG